MSGLLRRLLGGCSHGRPQYHVCGDCLAAISDEAAAVSR